VTEAAEKKNAIDALIEQLPDSTKEEMIMAYAYAFEALAARIEFEGDEFVLTLPEEALLVKGLDVAAASLRILVEEDDEDEDNEDA
jgi:hypothetical protein